MSNFWGEKSNLNKFIATIGDRKPNKVGFIPAESYNWLEDYEEYLIWQKLIGIQESIYFDINKPYSKDSLNKLMACDSIFLGGWNTMNFLQSIYNRWFLELLSKYIKNKNKTLIGLSAGSILMSKNITAASIWDVVLKENIQPALSLIDFFFYPHLNWYEWKSLEKIHKDILYFSKINKTTVYACYDGSWIIVDWENIQQIWKCIKYFNGKKIYS